MNTYKEFEFTIRDQHFLLLPQKALFWNNTKMLVISDVHLGKAGHFRKHGVALPQSSNDDNLHRIDKLIQRWLPDTILFLGDLFHSEKNEEWNSFKKWRANYAELSIKLVLGNHEVYPSTEYELLGIECFDKIQQAGMLFVHEESEFKSQNELYCVSGHIHPAIRMKGKGRQSLRLPCFYIQEQSMLLPAFGSLTGTYTIKPKKKELVIATIDDQLMQIQ